MGFMDHIFPVDVSWLIMEFYFSITLQASPWEVVTTGCLDGNVFKKDEVQLTSQIHCRWQYGQTRQKSCTISTLTVRNEEAITHHFSYDRPFEKQMGSVKGSTSY